MWGSILDFTILVSVLNILYHSMWGRIYKYVVNRQILFMVCNYNVVNILTNQISLTWSTQLWKPLGKLLNDIDTFHQNAILHLSLDVVNSVNGSSTTYINGQRSTWILVFTLSMHMLQLMNKVQLANSLGSWFQHLDQCIWYVYQYHI
jgi:hypothetical protein